MDPRTEIQVHGTVLDLRAALSKQASYCPRRPTYFDQETGEILSTSCWANSCNYCSRSQVKRRRKALRITQPDWFVTLTAVGDSWPEIRDRRTRLNQRLGRAIGSGLTMAWSVECDPNSPGHHIHGLGWGPSPQQDRLAEHADAVGMGRVVDLKPIRDVGLAAAYVMKQAQPINGQLAHYLEMNGSTFLHTSRGFWRDGRDGPLVKGGLRTVLRRRG